LNGKNSFELWKLKMCGLLVQQGLYKAFVSKSKRLMSMTDKDREDLDSRALKTICFCLAYDVLFNIVGEETTIGVWNIMESLHT